MADSGSRDKVPEGSNLLNLNSCISPINYSERACQYYQFANQASVWLQGLGGSQPNNARIIANFPTGTTANGGKTAQATVRAAALTSRFGDPVMVDFNTYNYGSVFYARAVKFIPVSDFITCISDLKTDASQRCWTMALIPGIEIRQGQVGDIIYSYTEANDINQNGIVVGVVKNRRKFNGTYAENVFINEGSSTSILGVSNSPLFFNGYAATASAINNANELVGKVDIETARDRARPQRGYIYLYGSAANLSSFNNTRGWLLDDLTNDNNTSSYNNKFRVAEAFDIAASAFFCATGYSSSAKNALCNDHKELVAVKLTRGFGNIILRIDDMLNINRSGGCVGVMGLGLLMFSAFLRRRKGF
ncbi:DUF3466 family protein [Candidatus Enterovibrio escicola]